MLDELQINNEHLLTERSGDRFRIRIKCRPPNGTKRLRYCFFRFSPIASTPCLLSDLIKLVEIESFNTSPQNIITSDQVVILKIFFHMEISVIFSKSIKFLI